VERLAIALFRPLRLILMGPFAKYRAIDSLHVANAMIKIAQNEGPAYEVLESNEISALSTKKGFN
jgi:hypothetical protein